jgi:hypothetical protein
VVNPKEIFKVGSKKRTVDSQVKFKTAKALSIRGIGLLRLFRLVAPP